LSGIARRTPIACAVAAACVLVVLALSACGGGASSTPPPSPSLSSGVEGHTLWAGGPWPGGPRPLPNVTVEIHAGGLDGAIVATALADKKGFFRADLPPGTYTLIVRKYDGRDRLPTTVTVTAGSYERVRVNTSVM